METTELSINERVLEIVLSKATAKEKEELGEYIEKAVKDPKYFSKILRKTLLNGTRTVQEVNEIMQKPTLMAEIFHQDIIKEAKRIKNPPAYSVMKDKTGYFTQKQIQDIINACKNERDALLIVLYIETNVRNSELLQLKPKDIDKNLQKLYLPIKKKKDRTAKDMFSISYKTYCWLLKYIEENSIGNNEHVFYSRWNEGKPISTRRVRYIVENACKKAGIETIGSLGKKPHPHHFRHSYAAHRLRQLTQQMKDPLAALNQLSKEMHHSDIKVTMGYTHFLESGKTDKDIRYWEEKEER